MKITTPLNNKDIKRLQVGDRILLSGLIFTMRDQAHKRLVNLIKEAKKNRIIPKLPFPLKGGVIYYTGPCPASPGRIIGSCGPTTSSRVDTYTLPLLKMGLKATIGKGPRSRDIVEYLKKYCSCYFVAPGGCGALISECVKECQVIAYPELGTEAIYRLYVENMPLTVAGDCKGRSIFAYKRKKDYLEKIGK